MLALVFQLWASSATPQDRLAGVKLKGNWQSCLEEDGYYAERPFMYVVNGVALWTLHLGPHDEFALYKGKGVDINEPHEHEGKENLLAPAFHVFDLNTWRGARTWSIPSLHLSVNVVAGGGSRAECDSFYVLVEKK